MSMLLAVPTPRGDADILDTVIAELERTGRSVDETSEYLVQRAAHTSAGWQGVSADVFELRTRAARDAVRTISHAHVRTAAHLAEYRDLFRESERASAHAMAAIDHAIHEYANRARGAIDHVVGHLRDFIDSNPVGELVDGVVNAVAHLVPGAEQMLHQLTGWQAPNQRPHADLCSEPPHHALDAGAILGHIKAVVGWGVSHLVSGASTLGHHIGQAFHWAVDKLHEVERWLARAISAALTAAKNALVRLWEFGKRVARALADLAVFLGRKIFEAVVALVEVVVDMAVALARLAYFLYELGGFLGAVAILLLRKDLAQRVPVIGHYFLDHRRKGDAAADDARFREILRDPERQRAADQHRQLAGDSYNDRQAGDRVTIGGTEWEVLETQAGPEGFYAVVYRNAAGEVVVAFRGSQGDHVFSHGNANDWTQDAKNAAGLPTEQGVQALAFAQHAMAAYGPDLTFSGHSLGGSLAAMASIATGAPADTFNAAGVGTGNYELAMAAGGHGSSETQITNFHAPNDVVTVGQEGTATTPAAGMQIEVPSDGTDPIEQHKLEHLKMPHTESAVHRAVA